MKPIAVFITTALLLNAIAPTLVHAATLLQGARVNANTLVRDAYVHVTYSDRSGEQKVVKGWIDAIGDSTFTIRSGDIKNRTVIAYDSVIAVIMSDESTVPVKQMNDVNRFLQQSSVVTYLHGAWVNANTLVRDAYGQVTYSDRSGEQKVVKGWIGAIGDSTFTIRSGDIRNRTIRRGGIRTRTVIAYDSVIAVIMSDESTVVTYLPGAWVNMLVRDAYVQVTYSDHSGEQKVVKGWIGAIGDSAFTIRSRGTKIRTIIAYDNVISLVTVIAKPTPIVTPVTPASGIAHHIGMMDPSRRIAIKAGVGFAVGIPLARLGSDRGDSYSKKAIGLVAGYTLGVAVGVSMVDPYDQFTSSFVGSFIGACAGMGLFYVDIDLSAMAVVIFPIIGAVIGSELWRRPPEASYFSVGLAPDRDGNLFAVVTLRF